MDLGMRKAVLSWVVLLALLCSLSIPAYGSPESVTIPGLDGFSLHARFYAANGFGAGVLLLHQCDRDGTATGYEALAPRLQSLGLSALILDLRGYGESVGEAFPPSAWQENRKHFNADITAAFDYLLARSEVRDDAAAVVGASCGGRYAMSLAEKRPMISSVVLISSALGADTASRALANRALFCAVGMNDPYGRVLPSTRTAFEMSTNAASRLLLYRTHAHGAPLFEHDPALIDTVTEWLAARLLDVPRVGTFRPSGGVRSPGDGGDARSAPLIFPLGLARDASGNLFMIERGASRIRRIDAGTGVITTISGDGQQGFAGDGGPASEARLNAPNNLVIDSAGNIIFSDTRNQRIRKIDGLNGFISTLAGNGEKGFSGDGGPAVEATLNGPYGLVLDREDNLYFADTDGDRIRRVDARSGLIRTVAGKGERGFSGDGGPALAAELFRPHVVAIDRFGNLVIGDSFNQRIRRVDHGTGLIETIAGVGELGSSPVGTSGLEARFGFFGRILALANGDLLFSEWVNSRIVRLTGSELTLDLLRDTHGSALETPRPAGMVLDSEGNLYWTEADVWDRHGRVRRLDRRTGELSHIAGGPPGL